jgi:hypothetical protein
MALSISLAVLPTPIHWIGGAYEVFFDRASPIMTLKPEYAWLVSLRIGSPVRGFVLRSCVERQTNRGKISLLKVSEDRRLKLEIVLW